MQPSTATSSYALEELWKSNLIVSARACDVTAGGTSFLPGQIVFVSEKRLGFGSFASSNTAQRFSNALTGWTLEEFDKLEAEARHSSHDAAWNAWVDHRTHLEPRCRSQYRQRPREAAPDCTQTRPAMLVMFTDDPIAAVVRVKRTQRLLRAGRTVTQGVKLEMAGADERQPKGRRQVDRHPTARGH